VVAQGGAALGFGDQQRQMVLDAIGEAVIEGGLQMIHGWIGLICQQKGTAKVDGGLRIEGVRIHRLSRPSHPFSRRACPTRPPSQQGH